MNQGQDNGPVVAAVGGLALVPDDEHNVIQVPTGAANQARSLSARLAKVRQTMGAAREDHLLKVHALTKQLEDEHAQAAEAEAQLLHHVVDVRREYESLINGLANQHVKRPGQYEFRPELGAFVRVRTDEEGQGKEAQ